MLSALPMPCSSAERYLCSPSVQYACSTEQCTRTTDGFQHAESFSFDPGRRTLGACLWTSCYEGDGTIYRGGGNRNLTVIGALKADSDTVSSPLVLSLTIDDQSRFVAVWQYDGVGLTFDQGRCTQVDPPEPGTAPR